MVNAKRILSVLLILLMFIMSIPITVFAEESDVGKSEYMKSAEIFSDEDIIAVGNTGENAFWAIDDKNTLTIYGTGDLYDFSFQKDTPWYSYKDEIEHLVIESGIERAHGVSFREYKNLKSVEIADTVFSIPSSFENCTALENIKLSAALIAIESYCFSGCTSLRNISIPKSVKRINSYAFRNCTELNDISFEDGYKELGFGVFDGTKAYNNPENIKDGILYIENCLIKEITAGSASLILDSKITGIASGWFNETETNISELIVLNPDCAFPDNSSAVPYGAVLKGAVNSTSQVYSDNFGIKFSVFCSCTDTVNIPESYGYCNGTVGYTEGEWCEKCKLWVSGHIEKDKFGHIDENSDSVCDFCHNSVDAIIISSGKCGDDSSWYITEGYSLNIKGIGDMYSFSKESAPWSAYAEKITYVFVSDGITSIGDYAFYNCRNIRSAVLSTVIAKIGSYSFYGCESLNKIDIPDTVYSVDEKAFFGCSSLRSIVIPESVTVLGKGIFEKCASLEKAEIKSKVFYVPDAMFSECESLTSFKSLYMPEVIGENAFFNCKKLSYITLNKVHTMGKNAFSLCESLEKISLNSIVTVPANAFKGCKGITDVTFGNSIKELSTSAFMFCTSLESVVLPESAATLKAGVFGGCTALKEVTLMNDNISISSSDVLYDGVLYKTIPVGVTIKANSASNGDIYSDENETDFVPLAEKEIISVELTKKPSQVVYFIGKDTSFSKSGATVTVFYADGTSVSLKNRFSLNTENADISKNGVYSVSVIYENYELPFEITVRDSYIFKGIPESRVFDEVYCLKNEITEVCFIPAETKEYAFAFDNKSGLEITADAEIFECGRIIYTGKQIYEQDKEYYFYIKAVYESKSVKISEIDNIYFNLCSDGTYEASFCVSGGDITIPAQYGELPVTRIADNFIRLAKNSLQNIERITVSEGIKEIGAGAFSGHKYDVFLPDTVKRIGKDAFRGCSGAVSLPYSTEYIEEGAFCNSGIGDVLLSENVKTVGKEAFSGCDSIEKLTILSKNITYGENVFAGCNNLKRADFCEDNISLGEYMFRDCKNLCEITGMQNLCMITRGAFFGCEALQKIELSDNITSVGEYAYFGCKGVTEVVFGANLKTIGQAAFSYLNAEILNLPDSIDSIGNGCFQNCASLTEIILPERINRVPDSLFNGCSSLEKVYSKGNITEIGAYAFYLCSRLTEVDFWDSVEKIEMYAFSQCDSLVSAPFENVTVIDRRAFRYCKALKNVNLPNENTHIGEEAFFGCTSLEEIDIKANSTVCDKAFSNCSAIQRITFRDNVLLCKEVISYCNNLKELYLFTYSEGKYELGVLPEKLIVYGYKNSSAENFAEENGYLFEAVDGHAHSFTVTTVEPERCFDFTKNIYLCECGYSYSENIHHTASYHYYKDFTVDKEPDCTEYGLKSKYCYCGKTRTDITLIEPLGHTEIVDIPAVVPTSTAPGYTHQSHCSVCGEIVVRREIISHGEYEIRIDNDTVTAHKLSTATNENDGADVIITFQVKNNVYMSNIDKTVIYKVGEVKLISTELTYNGNVQKPGVIVKDSVGEYLVQNKDYRLTYSAESKYCGEYTVRVDYIGNYAGSKTLYYNIVIDAIEPVVSDVTAESITLSWKTGHSDLNYRVYSVDVNGNMTKIADTKNSSYEISSLEPETEYSFLVRAYVTDENGRTYWGDCGKALLCITDSDNDGNSIFSMISFLRSFIERFKLLLQSIFRIKAL